MNIKKMKIYSTISKEDKVISKKAQIEWNKYFNFEHKTISPTKTNILNSEKRVDILFVSDKYFDKFSSELIQKLKNKNNQFNFVVLVNDDKKKIIHFLKNYADHVIRRDFDDEIAKWQSIAILRRYWNTYSKPTTILYKNIIADFIKNTVYINGKTIDLTSKELKLLWYFMNRIGEFISKEELFQKIWEVNDEDSTRVLNQMLFKLKKKIGKQYFQTLRKKGIKFE